MSPATGWPSRHQAGHAVPMIGGFFLRETRELGASVPHQRDSALSDHTAAENPCRACSGWLIPARAPARTLHLRPIAKHRIPGGPTMSCAVRHASTYSAHRSVGWSATPQASCVPLETGWVTCGGGGTDGPMTSGQYATQQQQWRPQADVDTAVRGRTESDQQVRPNRRDSSGPARWLLLQIGGQRDADVASRRGDGHVDVDRVDPDVHLGYAEVAAHIAQIDGRGG